MSLDVRAAALATGAGGLRGWAAKAQCSLCHTPARWRVYGRVASSNLTPHPEGVGGVDDDALLRAMSGDAGRDGRPLHRQAMPWDLTSNWSEEDRRAMLAYLRALPPVPGRVPGPRPPSSDDPIADTFAFGDRAIR